MNQKIKYLFKNTIVFAIGNIGTKLISFFLVPLYTNILLESEYGTVDLVITLGMFIVPILICNINEAVMRFLLDKGADQDKVISVGLWFVGILLLLSVLLYPIIRLYAPLAEYAALTCLYYFSLGCSTILLYNLRGKERLLRYSFGSIIHALSIALFNILFLVVFDFGLEGFLTAYIVSNFITAAYAFWAGDVVDSLKHFCLDRKLMSAMLRYSIVLIPNSFMWWIMDASNRVMLSSMVSLASTGLYAVANKLPSLISTISSIFNQAWNYSAIKENDSEDRVSFNNKVFSCLLGFVVFAGAILLYFIKPILGIYVAEDYYSAWTIVPPLVFGTCILVLATFLSSQYTVHKDSKAFLLSASCGAAINVVLNLLLIPIWNEVGAAVATCISYCVVLLYRAIDVRRYIKIQVFTVKNILLLALLACVAVSVYMEIVGVVFGGIALLVIIAFNLPTWLDMIKSVVSKRGNT